METEKALGRNNKERSFIFTFRDALFREDDFGAVEVVGEGAKTELAFVAVTVEDVLEKNTRGEFVARWRPVAGDGAIVATAVDLDTHANGSRVIGSRHEAHLGRHDRRL